MFCSKCGNIMPDGTRFCPSCGAEQHDHERAVNDFVQPFGQPLPSVGFGTAIKRFFQNYATFSGRARRSEYWLAILFWYIVSMALTIIAGDSGLTVLASLWSLATFVPALAIVVRRLHDTGKSGWYYLWILLPLVGWIIILVQLCKDSEPGTNQYGPNPKFCC